MATQFTTIDSNGPLRLDFKGTWDASTNTPTLVNGTGTVGTLYRVSVAGTTTLDTISFWLVDDYIYFDGSVWRRDNHNNVSGGAVIFRAEAASVTTSADLAPAVLIANPNAGTNSQMVYFTANLIAYATPPGAPPAADDTACWTVEGCIIRDQSTGTVSFPTPPIITPLYNSNGVDWDVLPVADNGTKTLKFTVTTDGFGVGPGVAPPASFFAKIELVPAGPL